MAIEYSQAARNKFNDVSYTDFKEFAQGIPDNKLQQVIKGLPRENGFRPGKDTEIRLQKYFTRLKRDSAEDWSILLKLWLTYTECHATIRGAMGSQNSKELERIVKGMLSSVDSLREAITKVLQVAHAEDLTKELLQNWLLFSPFELDGEIDKLLALAPTNSDTTLKKRVNSLEKRVKALEQDDEKSKVIQIIEKEIQIIKQDLSTNIMKFGSNERDLQETKAKINQLELLLNEMNAALKATNEEGTSIRNNQASIFNKLENFTKEIQGLWESLNGYTARLDDLERLEDDHIQLCAYVENLQWDMNSKASAAPILANKEALAMDIGIQVQNEQVSAQDSEIVKLEQESDILSHLAKNINRLGVKLPHARKLSVEIQAALATGQMVTFEGSFASLLAECCARSLTGAYTLIKIPFGMIQANSLENHIRELIKDSQEKETPIACIIEGINRSSFEIYGSYLKKIITERSLKLKNDFDFVFFFATTIEGPSVITAGIELLELGPLFSVDSIGWMNKPASMGSVGLISKATWVQETQAPQLNDDLEEALIPDWILMAAGSLWRRNLIIADSYGRKLNEAIETTFEFTLFGWVVPMLIHLNSSSIEMLSEYINRDDRLKWLVYKKAPEVIKS
ncbi:hypothetical protein MO973_00665 [Paenibacillus sp. TRM 82003]|nr:hypothetical protein [Paenibacillus sp. TRM 82003]